MTHDPLCYLYREDGEFNLMADRCVNCRLIAKVRADEQHQVAIRLTAYHTEGCIGTRNLGCGCGLWTDVVTSSIEMP